MKEYGLNTIRLPVGYWCVPLAVTALERKGDGRVKSTKTQHHPAIVINLSIHRQPPTTKPTHE